jgi:squalene-associated FAD-dependent desaturase
MRSRPADAPDAPTVGQWLAHEGQSARAIELFWSVILTSALGENLERASLAAARKVIVDGFLAAREAYVVEVPQAPLSALYGEPLERWLTERGVGVRLATAVRRVTREDRPCVTCADGQVIRPDAVVVALPWFKLADVVDERIAVDWPWLEAIRGVPASPITGVHLWFDRPLTNLDHAVLVGRLSQWIFKRTWQGADNSECYYQVVISASRELGGRERGAIVTDVCRELAEIWPQASQAKLLRARVVTEQAAVFSVRPGLERARPAQRTGSPGVFVAGDWTATDWPATMEGAVRSGYLAAEAVLAEAGRPRRVLVEDLPRGWLARLLVR